jgi:hypothetical protein
MKYLILIALIGLGMPQQPTKSPEGEGATKSASPQVGQQSSSAKQNNGPSPNTPTGNTQTLSEDENAAQADANIRIQGKLVLFTGLLVVVGFLQISVMVMQWYTIRRQTIFQQVALSQWVDMDDWGSSSRPIFGNTTEARVLISYSLRNLTKLKLTLKRISSSTEGQARDFLLNHILVPEGDPYPVELPIVLRGEKLQLFHKNSLVLIIDGEITFEDAFGHSQPQQFSYIGICGETGLRDVTVYQKPLPNKGAST